MARNVTYNKRENEKKKQARRVEKQSKKEQRKLSGKPNSFEDMIAYVDENGQLSSTPPIPTAPAKTPAIPATDPAL